jgi:putative PEP-CTERM system TPR-repeat lipoprotein
MRIRSIRSICGALLLSLCVSGCVKSVPELVRAAQQHRAQGDFGAAIIELKNALDQDPANAEAHELIGRIYADSGALLDAEKELRKAQELGALPARVLPVLGRVLIGMERYQQVLDEISPAKLDAGVSTLAEIALLQGEANLGLGKTSDARTQYLLAMRDNPLPAKLGLAHVATAEGDVRGALKLIDEVLADAPDSAEAWQVKGDVLRGESKNEQALAAYRQATKLRPDFALAHLSQAIVHISAGNYGEAKGEIETARKISPSGPMFHYTQALLALHEGNYQICGDSVKQVLQVIPQYMPAIMLSGALFFATGQLEQAQNAFNAYLARFPGNVYTRKMLAATMLRKEQPQGAADALQPLLALGLQDAELLGLAGQAYLQLGEVSRARAYLEKVIALDPASARAHTNLGLARLAGGDRQGAVAELESAVALNPAASGADRYLVMALLAQNDTDKALQVASALEKRRPDDTDSHMLTGAVHMARQDFASARASYERAIKLKPAFFPAAAALAQLDLRANDAAAARARMTSILQHDKNSLDAMLALAKFDLDGGRRSEAVEWIRRAQSEHPQAPQAYLLMAQVHLQAGEASDAVSVASQARHMNPKDPRALDMLGRAQLAAGDKSAAIVTFNTLVGMQSRSILAQLDLANAYQANGEYRQATAVLKKALEIDPANVDVRVALGTIYLQTGRVREAADVASQLQKQNPRSAPGYALEGDALMMQADYARAAKAYEKADSLRSNGLVRISAHEAQSLAQKGIASDAPLLAWLEQHPGDVDVRMYLGEVYLKEGKREAAIAQYQSLLRDNPKNVRALNNMALSLQQAGDPRALDYAQQALQLKPNDGIVADTLGWLLVAQGKLNEGLQVMIKAVSLSPDNPEIRYHLIQALVQAGDNARARNELKILLESGKPFAQANEARALLKRLSP